MMFTFDFGWMQRDACGLQALLTTLVVQALCFLFINTSEPKRPEAVLKILKGHSNPTSELVLLFEMVNFSFRQRGWRPLWVIWDIDRCLDSIEEMVGTLKGCCKYSEVSPSILLAGGTSETCLAVLDRLNIQTLALPKPQSPGLGTSISLDVEALTADFPMLVENKGDIRKILKDFLPNPRIYQCVLRSIRSLASSETAELDLTPYQSDKPELIFKKLVEIISEDRGRQQTGELLRWITCSRRTLSISEATTALSLETFLTNGIETPWRSYRFKRSRQSQRVLEKAEEDSCGIVTLDATHFAFTHSLLGQTYSVEGGGYIENLHILDRLLRLLELEAGCEDSPVVLSTSSLFSLYAAQHWPEHYRIARQSELTGQRADGYLERFLENDGAVQYLLTMRGYSVGRVGSLKTASSRKVALLTRCGIEIDSIKHFTKDPGWTADSDLLFAAFLGAINASFITFVQKVPVKQLQDKRKIEQVLDEASVVANAEIMEALFAQVSDSRDITIPSSFLQKAMDLGLQAIFDRIFNQPDWALKMEIGSMFKKCALSGSVGVAENLVKREILKKPEFDKLFSQVLDESCKNCSPDIISFVFRHREGKDLELWKSLGTACEYGNHNAVRMILENIDGLTWDTWADNRFDGLVFTVGRGFEKCTGVILEFMNHTDSGGEEYMRRALLEGLDKAPLGTSTQLLQACPEILDSETTKIAFRRALDQGRLKIVQLLLEYGAPLDVDLDGFTPLHIAASNGFTQGVEYLLSKGAGIDSIDFRGATPLIYACFNQHSDVAKLLLNRGADTRLSMTHDPRKDWSALEAAHRCPEIIEMLTNNSPQLDFKRQAILGGGHITALYLAAANGITESVRMLLQQDVELEFEREPDSQFEKAWTALNAAVAFGHYDAARLLLEQGADVNHVDKDSDHPMHMLARTENERILVLLLEYNPNAWGLDQGLNSALSTPLPIGSVTRLLNAGADPNAIDTRDEFRDTPLINACSNSTDGLDTIRLLIRRNANIQGASPSRRGSPLHFACEYKGLDLVQLLLDARADINFHVPHLGTPLQRCCDSDFDPEAKVRLLVEKGADVNAEGSSCENILTLACFRGSISIVSCLVEQGAQVTTPDIVGCLPIFAACLGPDSRQDLVERLLSWGADLGTEVRDKMGRTTLHYAALGGDLSLVEWLIAKEPSLITAKDADGWTAIHWALKPPFLRSAGSDDSESSMAARAETKAAIIRLLVVKGCPGINDKVRVGDDGEWSAARIARYFNAPLAVEKLLGELSQSDVTEDKNLRKGLSLGGSCDGCYCVSGEWLIPSRQTMPRGSWHKLLITETRICMESALSASTQIVGIIIGYALNASCTRKRSTRGRTTRSTDTIVMNLNQLMVNRRMVR